MRRTNIKRLFDGRLSCCGLGTSCLVNAQRPVAQVFGQLVSAEPELRLVELDPSDRFVVLACDGIWDVLQAKPLKAVALCVLCVFHTHVSHTNPCIINWTERPPDLHQFPSWIKTDRLILPKTTGPRCCSSLCWTSWSWTGRAFLGSLEWCR